MIRRQNSFRFRNLETRNLPRAALAKPFPQGAAAGGAVQLRQVDAAAVRGAAPAQAELAPP